MKPRKYEQGWERDDRIADFPEWVKEAEYETEMYRKYGHKRRATEDEQKGLIIHYIPEPRHVNQIIKWKIDEYLEWVGVGRDRGMWRERPTFDGMKEWLDKEEEDDRGIRGQSGEPERSDA